MKLSLTFVLLLAGCATSNQKVEHGPQGTIAYNVQIESSDPGARVDANGDYVGKTPMTLRIFGDKDGTFHNFGSYLYTIQAFPNKPGQYVQTKTFRTGGWFMPEDKIPSRIYFDMNLAPVSGSPVPVAGVSQPQQSRITSSSQKRKSRPKTSEL